MKSFGHSTTSRSSCSGVAAEVAAGGEGAKEEGRGSTSPPFVAAPGLATHTQEQQQQHRRKQQRQQQQHHFYYTSAQQLQRQQSLRCQQQQEGNPLQQQVVVKGQQQDNSEQQRRRQPSLLKEEQHVNCSSQSPQQQDSYEYPHQRQSSSVAQRQHRQQLRYGQPNHHSQQGDYQERCQQRKYEQQQKYPQQQQQDICQPHEQNEEVEAADYWGVARDVEEAAAAAAAAGSRTAGAARETVVATREKRGGAGGRRDVDERGRGDRRSTEGEFSSPALPSLSSSSSSSCALPASPDAAQLHSFSSFSVGAPTQASLIKEGRESSATAAGITEAGGSGNSAGAAVSAFLRGRPKSGYVPYNPYGLSRSTRQLLEWTELPFVILWIYFTYFIVIVSLTAPKVKKLVWVNAVVAGSLVGLGLNANAYRAIMYRGYPDIGMIIRFFLIPFGVSALAGLTNSLREKFVLVFPKEPLELLLAVACPAVVVSVLLVGRLFILYTHHVPITLRNFMLNGRIYF